jgi:hypothetical protein
MLWASDVDVAEGTWVKDLHCSLVSLPMLWPSTSVMGLRVLEHFPLMLIHNLRVARN